EPRVLAPEPAIFFLERQHVGRWHDRALPRGLAAAIPLVPRLRMDPQPARHLRDLARVVFYEAHRLSAKLVSVCRAPSFLLLLHFLFRRVAHVSPPASNLPRGLGGVH